MRFFNFDSPVMQFLTKIADLFILNILFLICCIPVVTIGTSLTALYTMTLKAARNEDGYILRGFFQAFKRNFKISTLAWLIFLVAGIILWADFRIVSSMPVAFGKVLQALTSAVTLLYLMTLLYLFPYIARFENTVTGSIKNAFLLAVTQLPYTLLIAVITVLAVVASLFINFQIIGFVWFVIGFSGLSYIQSIFYRKVFAKFE